MLWCINGFELCLCLVGRLSHILVLAIVDRSGGVGGFCDMTQLCVLLVPPTTDVDTLPCIRLYHIEPSHALLHGEGL